MDEGKILVEGSPEELVQRHIGSQVMEIWVRPDEKGGLMATLQERGLDLEDRGDSIVLYGKDGAESLDNLNEDDYRLTRRPGNLEDVFLRLTGRGLREE